MHLFPSSQEAHGLALEWRQQHRGRAGTSVTRSVVCDKCCCLVVFPLRALVPVTSVCHSLFAVGVSGNVVTVLQMGLYRDVRTTTNLYLGSMSVSNLLILLNSAQPVPPVLLEAVGVRAASLLPVSLPGRGLHLSHATTHDRTQC